MAKYLVDSKAKIDPSWYRLADEIVKGAPPEPHMEIPQLWNMRGNSRIKLKNGRLIDMVTGLGDWKPGSEMHVEAMKCSRARRWPEQAPGHLWRCGEPQPHTTWQTLSPSAIQGLEDGEGSAVCYERFGLDRFELAQRHALQGQPKLGSESMMRPPVASTLHLPILCKLLFCVYLWHRRATDRYIRQCWNFVDTAEHHIVLCFELDQALENSKPQ